MNVGPLITIFVRHSEDCKYGGDEFSKRCQCRKHLRWSHNGKQHRRKAGTRSWAEAEKVKRDIEDQLAGREPAKAEKPRSIAAAADLFIQDKRVQGLSDDAVTKYALWLGRLRDYCEARGIHTIQGITREVITGFCSDWPERYPSTLTRAKLRERYKSFMRYCHEAEWLDKLPVWPTIKIETPPTMPLTAEEYARLLDAVVVTVKAPMDAVVESQTHEYWVKRVRGLFQLMRWSGLAIMDALTLRRDELTQRNGHYRVVTSRQKTGTDVSVVVPLDIAEELLAVPNDNPTYFFWSGVGAPKSITGNWGKRFIVPAFDEAKIPRNGHMLAHRLRDTFAVDLLEKGVPLEDVSKLLGHTSVKTTEKHYAAWVQGRQDRLDALVSGTWAKPKTLRAKKPKRA
jgi:site-specific recombinase XerD